SHLCDGRHNRGKSRRPSRNDRQRDYRRPREQPRPRRARQWVRAVCALTGRPVMITTPRITPEACAPVTVSVALGTRSSEVLIGSGLLAGAAGLIGDRLGAAKFVIVT